MKYLLLFVVCYAVKCEDVSNNYFVVKMPEDNIQLPDVKDFKKSFQVYWNVPTMQCASKKIPFQNLYEKFGIIQNDKDQFIGNKIVVIYNETDFPSIIKNKTSRKNVLRNGGVPQEGSLENHLTAFENNLNDKIPDPYFDGVAIIDFESWRPVFRQNFGSFLPHRTLSIEIEKNLHNWWPKMWIEKEATLRFEAAARRFMQTTLSMAKVLRPNALWGYYGFPYCYNMRGRDMAEKCAANINMENDSIYWLWAESTALFPSIYSSVSLSSSQLSSLIKGRVKETSRVRGGDTPIFPYFWFRYRDAGFITEKDLEVVLDTLYQSKASGLIIWGSSNDVNTVDKCNKLLQYVETVLGPKISKYTKPIKKIHKNRLENKDIYKMETSTAYDGLYYSESTRHFYTDKLFSTQTSTDYNKFTETDENTQTSNNDEMSSTESAIKYNEYTNTEDSQTSDNFDFILSILEPSTDSELMFNQTTQTLNNDEIFATETAIAPHKYTNDEEYSQSLSNDNIFSTEILKAYSTYTNIDQNTKTLNNNENSTARKSNTNIGESSQTSNIDISDKQTPNVYSEYTDAGKKVNTLISANLISLSESSSTDYKKSDHKKTTYNNDMSLSKISTIDNSYKEETSQTSNNHVLNEETKIVNNENSETEDNLPTPGFDDIMSASETSTIYAENRDYVMTTVNNEEMSLSTVSTIDNSYTGQSSLTSNDHASNKETTIASSTYYETEKNVQPLNIDEVISSSVPSTIYDDNNDFITTTLNNDEESLSIFINELSNEDKSSQTSNNHIPNKVSTVSSKMYNENRDQSTSFFDSEMSSTDMETLYSKNVNTDQNKEASNDKEILSELTYLYYDHHFSEDQNTESLNKTKYLKETSPPEVSYTEGSTDILLEGEMIPKQNEFETNGDYIFNNNMLPNSSEDRSDYLIILENSTNTETLNQSECQNSTNIEDDYLIIVQQPKNEQNLKENIRNSTLETAYATTEPDVNYEVATKSEHFSETANDIDLVVKYIDKKIGIKSSEELTTKADSFHSIWLSNSGDDDKSDYLIIADNFTNIGTYNQSENTNVTNADNDYLIIVPDYNNEIREQDTILDNNLDLHFTTQANPDFETDTNFEDFGVTVYDIDPVVAYINKTKDNMTFQDTIPTGDESFNNDKFISDEDASDYLIRLVNFTNMETVKQSEYTDNTGGDNDDIIIIKNLDD